ncbi:MAG: type 4a pilus biogenesis protein PilO [Planctomycetes bacterium]|nr:type 4a pilus biogenesis protein PilO [Planctomycetota bacterium]
MKPSPREIVFALVLLAIPMAAWQLEFVPRRRRQNELKQAIAAKQAKLDRLFEKKQLSGAIGDLRSQIAEGKEIVAIFRSRLPDEKDIDQIVKEIWRLAKSSKLSPTSLRTIPPRKNSRFTNPDGPHGEQPLLIQLEGSFTGLYSFMLDMESQSRIMRVRQMTLKKPEKGLSGQVSATIEFSIFFERKKGETQWTAKI